MIEVTVLRALEDKSFGKKANFKQGEKYFARLSKNEDFYVLRSEEGYWIPVHSFKIGYSLWTFKPEGFVRESIIYMRNRKRLNEFFSVEHYFDGDNAKKWWYGSMFMDKELYKR